MSPATRLAAHLGRPLNLLDRRIAAIEKWLKIPLPEVDERLVREACAMSGGKRLGSFYHWYLLKLLVARAVRGIDRQRALSLINACDKTDYTSIRSVLSSDRGVLIAIPHHAHYIFSMIALAEKVRAHRLVYVFYGQPDTHRGNEIFDHLHQRIWGNAANVQVIHDTRQGMAKAIKGLKNGAVVLIMPDVFQNESDTMVVPFCGRALNVMMGTATLARRTKAWILPAVSTRHGRGLGFVTRFGTRIDYRSPNAQSRSAASRIADYGVTRILFKQFEDFMSSELLYWQNVRQFLAQGSHFQTSTAEQLMTFAEQLAADPLMQLPRLTVDLRSQNFTPEAASQLPHP